MDTYSISERLEHYARMLGYDAGQGFSLAESSGSGYLHLHLRHSGEPIEVKVRVADHPPRPTYEALNGVADYEVGAHDAGMGDWADCVVYLSRRAGKPVPAPVRGVLTRRAHAQYKAEKQREAYRRAEAVRVAARKRDFAMRLAALPAHEQVIYERLCLRAQGLSGKKRKRANREANNFLRNRGIQPWWTIA